LDDNQTLKNNQFIFFNSESKSFTAKDILQNIKNITQDDLRSVISYVPQEPILFHRTIKENIMYSRPNATDDEVIAVAKSAYAHDFIVGLPDGYDTLVGERGVKLSGGERQRVAIARAIVTQPDIIIADEPTGNLDPMNTYEIVQILKKINDLGTTIILTTHNKGVIDSLKRRVITMENGKIVRDDKEGKYNI
jgi:ATP-binding cassette subfamily B protein